MSLSARGKDIIILLLKNPSGYPLTLSAISEQLQVSRRTISREIPEIKTWMSKRGYSFRAQAGTGLMMEETAERKQAILKELTGETMVSNQMRVKNLKEQLIEMLLYTEEPIKMTYLCYVYKISEGTLNKELLEAERWLGRYGVKLVRRSGSGIFLTYTEQGYRLAMEAFIAEYYNTSELLSLLYKKETATKKEVHIPEFMVAEEASAIGEILIEAEKRMDVNLTDSSYLGLFVMIALAIFRVRKGNEVEMNEEKMADLQMLSEYSVAEFVADHMEMKFGVLLSVHEKSFLAMRLAGSKIWKKSFIDQTDTDRLDVLHLTISVIDAMEKELGISFGEDEKLLQGLCNHLQSTCNQLRLRTPIVHPQLFEIKSVYKELFYAVKKVSKILEKELDIPFVPEDEVAYISMHFGAVLEERRVSKQQIYVVVVCPTGIGTSRLLATKMKRLFPEIVIKDMLSVMNIDVETLHKEHIDLIVSTVELEVDFPHICVNPMLTERDSMLISATVDSIRKEAGKENGIADTTSQKARPQSNMQFETFDVEFISQLGSALLSVIREVRFSKEMIVKGKAELIAKSAELFGEDATASNDIEMALIRREQLSDTYIKPLMALLLHCKTPFVETCKFGYVALDVPIYQKGNVILGAVVMLIPEEDSNDVCRTLMSEITSILLMEPELLKRMRSGDEQKAREVLKYHLIQSYQAILQQKLSFGVKEVPSKYL